MKPIAIDDLFSEEELFYLYKLGTSPNNWSISGVPNGGPYISPKTFNASPQFTIKDNNGQVLDYAMFVYFQSIIFR